MADRHYAVEARTTDVFGRILCSARQQHFVIDGPPHSGCPGEALQPPEAFLGAVAACGAELVGVIARESGVPLGGVVARVEGTIPAQRLREDVSLFASVHLHLELRGVGDEDAARLVEAFKAR